MNQTRLKMRRWVQNHPTHVNAFFISLTVILFFPVVIPAEITIYQGYDNLPRVYVDWGQRY